MELTLTALTTTTAEFVSNYGLWISLTALAVLIGVRVAHIKGEYAGRVTERAEMLKLPKNQFQALKRK